MATSSWYNSQWQTLSAQFAKSHLRRSRVLRPKVRLSPDTSASLASSLLTSLNIRNTKQHLCCSTDSKLSRYNSLLCKQTKLALATCSIQSRTSAPTLRFNKTLVPLKRNSQSTCQSSCAPCRRASGRNSSKWAEWAKVWTSACKAPHSSLLVQREACFTEFSCTSLIQTQAWKFQQMLDPSQEKKLSYLTAISQRFRRLFWRFVYVPLTLY